MNMSQFRLKTNVIEGIFEKDINYHSKHQNEIKF